MRRVKRKIVVYLLLVIFCSNFMLINIQESESIDPYFTLVFKTNGGGVRPDYGNFLKQHLARMGINIEVIVQDWSTFVSEMVAFRDFDIC